MSDITAALDKPLTCEEAERVQPQRLTDQYVPFVGCKLHWIRVQIERARKKLKHYQSSEHHMLPVTSALPGSSRAEMMAAKWQRFLDEMLLLQTRNQYRIEKLRVRVKETPHLLATRGVQLSRGQLVTIRQENRLWYLVDSAAGSGYLSKSDVHLSAPVDISDFDRNQPFRKPPPQRDSIEAAVRDTIMR